MNTKTIPDNILYAGVVLSLVVHAALLLQRIDFNTHARAPKNAVKAIAVNYVRMAAPPEVKKEHVQPERRDTIGIQGERLQPRPESLMHIPLHADITALKPPPFIEGVEKDGINDWPEQRGPRQIAASAASLTKPSAEKEDIINVKKKVMVPDMGGENFKNPSYISYYQVVREKIKRAAYQTYTGREMGAVAVSFIIHADGSLQGVRLIEEKSASSGYLRKIALDCIGAASPFPVFPDALNSFPELSFNVAITFEVE